MPDYGHPLEFGYFLLPDIADPAGLPLLEPINEVRGRRDSVDVWKICPNQRQISLPLVFSSTKGML